MGQRNIGNLVTLKGQKHRQRRLGRARYAQQHDIGTRQIVAAAPVIVLNKILHGLDTMEIAVIGFVNHARDALGRHANERRQHGERRADQVDRADMQHTQVIEHAGAKRRIDNGMEHGNIAMVCIDTRAHKRFNLLHRVHLGQAQEMKSPFIKLPGRRKHHLTSGIAERVGDNDNGGTSGDRAIHAGLLLRLCAGWLTFCGQAHRCWRCRRKRPRSG